MVGAIADLLARFSLAIFTYFYMVDSRMLFFAGTCVTVLLRIGEYSVILAFAREFVPPVPSKNNHYEYIDNLLLGGVLR